MIDEKPDDGFLRRMAIALINSGYIKDDDSDNIEGLTLALREILAELNSHGHRPKAA